MAIIKNRNVLEFYWLIGMAHQRQPNNKKNNELDLDMLVNMDLGLKYGNDSVKNGIILVRRILKHEDEKHLPQTIMREIVNAGIGMERLYELTFNEDKSLPSVDKFEATFMRLIFDYSLVKPMKHGIKCMFIARMVREPQFVVDKVTKIRNELKRNKIEIPFCIGIGRMFFDNLYNFVNIPSLEHIPFWVNCAIESRTWNLYLADDPDADEGGFDSIYFGKHEQNNQTGEMEFVCEWDNDDGCEDWMCEWTAHKGK